MSWPETCSVLGDKSQPQRRTASAFHSINKCYQLGLFGLPRAMAAGKHMAERDLITLQGHLSWIIKSICILDWGWEFTWMAIPVHPEVPLQLCAGLQLLFSSYSWGPTALLLRATQRCSAPLEWFPPRCCFWCNLSMQMFCRVIFSGTETFCFFIQGHIFLNYFNQ